MLINLLINERLDIITKHKNLTNKLIKCNILTLDKQISDKTGTLIRDWEHNTQKGNMILKKWYNTAIYNDQRGV